MQRKVKTILGFSMMLTSLFAYGQKTVKETVDVTGQGPGGPVVAENGATIVRSPNGISARLKMPTPEPYSYEYPLENAFQATVEPGPPEVFTGWIFIFNNPAGCIGPCDGSDLMNPDARGGAYNFAGHVVGGATLTLVGHVSTGEETFLGYTLDNPVAAEVHLAVAPHGKLQPELLPTQITTPIGTPANWWLAIFMP